MPERTRSPGEGPAENPGWAEQFFELADVILIGIGPDGRVRRVNRKGCALLGYSREEIVGRNWFDAFLPARLRGEVWQVFLRIRDEAEELPERYENAVLCRDGSERIVAWRNAAMRDKAGRIAEIVGSGEDVTDRRRAEDALRESEARFRATFEQAAVAMAHVGLDGRFLRLNEKLCDFTGYDRAELQARVFADITHPDDLEADLARVRALHTGDIPFYRREKRYIRKDGATAWGELTVSLVRDAQGRPDYFVAVVEDIGPRKQAEALRADEALQRMALSAAHAGAWKWNAETGALLWSPEIYELYGLDPGAGPLGLDEWLSRCVAPEDRTSVEAFLRDAGNEDGEYRLEFRSHHPQKGLRWVRAVGRLVGDGSSLKAYGLSFDITDQRQAKEALRDSEERLRLAMAAGNIGVWDWDIRTGIVRWTDDPARPAGMEPGTCEGDIDAFRALVHPEDRQATADALAAALAGRSEYNVEFRMIRPDGGIRWSATWAIVLRDSAGQPVRVVGIDMDITARKEAEERQQRLADELDHRVKNVVAVIQTIASQTLSDSPAREAFLDRLTALANAHGLLTANRWESVDLGALVRQELAPYPDGRVTCDGPPVPVPSRLTQTLALVLHELATNAAKYGALSGSQGSVDVRWSVREPDGPVLELVWRETGGPPATAPERTGFGTRVIEGSVAMEGGTAERLFRPEGVTVRLTLPLQ